MRIKQLYIENYEGIKKTMITFGDGITCFAGPNNTGKHTLFNAMTVVQWYYENDPPLTALLEHRRRGATGPTVLVFTVWNNGKDFVYTFSFDENGVHDYVNTGDENDKTAFLDFLDQYMYSPYLSLQDFVFANNDNLESIGKGLRDFFPNDIERVWTEENEPGYKDIMVKSPDFEEPFNLYDFSPTTVRIAQYLAMVECGEPAILILEDPDSGLEAWSMRQLVGILEAYCVKHRRQVFISTYNPYLVSCLLPGEVYLSEKENGECTFTCASQYGEIMDIYEGEIEWWYNAYLGLD